MIAEKFGAAKSGEEVSKYTLENKNGIKMTVISLGATIVSLEVPDKDGNMRDVMLGYDTAADYQNNTCYFGAVIGRNSNRIKDAVCTIDGVQYVLEQNDNENNLHSGGKGFHNAVWKANIKEGKNDEITFTYLSKDGEQGFPGNMTVQVTYTLSSVNELVITYEATSDQTTAANLTNHAYFNLNGHDAGSIEEQELQLLASFYTPVIDQKAIPTGEIASALDTPMDFLTSKTIGRDIAADFDQLKYGGGYDHNYVIDREDSGMALAAVAKSAESGIGMEVYTDCLGIQLYTGNFISEQKGKNGVTYGKRQGFCLETQYFPNGINEPNFTKPLLEAGKTYLTSTKYKFYVS